MKSELVDSYAKYSREVCRTKKLANVHKLLDVRELLDQEACELRLQGLLLQGMFATFMSSLSVHKVCNIYQFTKHVHDMLAH